MSFDLRFPPEVKAKIATWQIPAEVLRAFYLTADDTFRSLAVLEKLKPVSSGMILPITIEEKPGRYFVFHLHLYRDHLEDFLVHDCVCAGIEGETKFWSSS